MAAYSECYPCGWVSELWMGVCKAIRGEERAPLLRGRGGVCEEFGGPFFPFLRLFLFQYERG